MITTKHNTLTARGLAAILARGISAGYEPKARRREAERLVEYLQDLACYRDAYCELPGTTTAQRTRAKQDAEWLDAIASELDNASR